jgi:hypothetical protein
VAGAGAGTLLAGVTGAGATTTGDAGAGAGVGAGTCAGAGAGTTGAAATTTGDDGAGAGAGAFAAGEDTAGDTGEDAAEGTSLTALGFPAPVVAARASTCGFAHTSNSRASDWTNFMNSSVTTGRKAALKPKRGLMLFFVVSGVLTCDSSR